MGIAMTGSPSWAAGGPSISLSRVTIERTKPDGGYAGTVDLKFRLCAIIGPRAVILVREARVLGGVTKASYNWLDPLGVDLDRVYPYACEPNYQASWIVKTRLIRGPGTYTVSIRVRDGYGRVSAPISFSLKAGAP
jgi:hypothetical protein